MRKFIMGKFNKSPIQHSNEQEKAAEQFIKKARPVTAAPEEKKQLSIRVPIHVWSEIQEIMRDTGITMNAVCVSVLRLGIKKKLKELQDDSF